MADNIRKFFQNLERYLGEREEPEQEVFNFDLRDDDAETNNTYVLDENVVLSMVEHTDFRTTEENGLYSDTYSETWRDVIDFLEESYRRDDVELVMYPSDTVSRGRIDNGETGMAVENVMDKLFTPIDLGKVDREIETTLEPRDERIVNAAYQKDGKIITYDTDFLNQNQVEVNTPLGEYLSMINYD